MPPATHSAVVLHHPETVAVGTARLWRGHDLVASVAVHIGRKCEAGGHSSGRAGEVGLARRGTHPRIRKMRPTPRNRIVVHRPEEGTPLTRLIDGDDQFGALVAVDIGGYGEAGERLGGGWFHVGGGMHVGLEAVAGDGAKVTPSACPWIVYQHLEAVALIGDVLIPGVLPGGGNDELVAAIAVHIACDSEFDRPRQQARVDVGVGEQPSALVSAQNLNADPNLSYLLVSCLARGRQFRQRLEEQIRQLIELQRPSDASEDIAGHPLVGGTASKQPAALVGRGGVEAGSVGQQEAEERYALGIRARQYIAGDALGAVAVVCHGSITIPRRGGI